MLGLHKQYYIIARFRAGFQTHPGIFRPLTNPPGRQPSGVQPAARLIIYTGLSTRSFRSCLNSITEPSGMDSSAASCQARTPRLVMERVW